MVQNPIRPGPRRCQGFTITLKTHHNRQDSSGEVISPMHRTLHDNTEHSQETDIHHSGGTQTLNPSKRTDEDQFLIQCEGVSYVRA